MIANRIKECTTQLDKGERCILEVDNKLKRIQKKMEKTERLIKQLQTNH